MALGWLVEDPELCCERFALTETESCEDPACSLAEAARQLRFGVPSCSSSETPGCRTEWIVVASGVGRGRTARPTVQTPKPTPLATIIISRAPLICALPFWTRRAVNRSGMSIWLKRSRSHSAKHEDAQHHDQPRLAGWRVVDGEEFPREHEDEQCSQHGHGHDDAS